MNFTISNPKEFQTIIDGLSVIVDECGFTFTENGMSIRALDKSHIAFMCVDIDKYFFDEYECDNELAYLDINQLGKIMKRCKSNDIMLLDVDGTNAKITFKGESSRSFTLRLIDEEYQSPNPPEIDYPVNLNIPTVVLNDALTDMGIYSDNLSIGVDEIQVIFRADGNFGEAETNYIHGEKVTEFVQSQFSIEKLKEIMKTKGFSESLEIGLGDDMPLTIKMSNASDDAHISYMLAPRITTE